MSYYDIVISHIPIGEIDLEPKMVTYYDGTERPHLPITVKEMPLEWWRQHYAGTDEGCPMCELNINDNGDHGDGIVLTIKAGEQDIVWCRLPDESLSTLIEALTAVRRLRAAERDSLATGRG